MVIQAILDKSVSSNAGLSAPASPLNEALIRKAYDFAKKAHEGQQRLSGDDYLTHLMGVADILAELHMDSVTIATGLLHDVLEDTTVTFDDLKDEFGNEIAELVNGVTKLSAQNFKDGATLQAGSTRKMLVAMAKDVRVILIKLADRTHNMRTLDYLPPERREKMAKETQDLYAPLAHRLGIAKIKVELEDLCLRHLQPDVYADLVQKVAMKKTEREKNLEDVIQTIRDKLTANHVVAQIQGRSKHFASIYHKMVAQKRTFDEIFDLMAIRVLTDSDKDCYGALGLIHELWTPMPGRFKDYIAMPKGNGYKSLHTTVMGPAGKPLEIQIRTNEMHLTAEDGIAAHWIYKEKRGVEKDDAKFAWMRQLLDLQQDIEDTTESPGSMKVDVFDDEVFVFTPKGLVKELPKDATALDFAYEVHTDVGTHCMGVKVNGQMVPMRYKLKNGDIVEVLTQSSRSPSRDWLKIVTTHRAKNKIRHWFRTHLSAEEIDKGKHLFEKEAQRMGVDFGAVLKTGALEGLLETFGCHGVDELLANTGHGEISPKSVLNKLTAKAHPEEKTTKPERHGKAEDKTPAVKTNRGVALAAPQNLADVDLSKGIIISGQKDLLIRFARCCTPVPGDPIMGYVTRGRGLSVHRTDCPNTLQLPEGEDRMIPVSWDGKEGQVYEVAVEVKAKDREKLLADMLLSIAEEKIVINEASARALEGGWAQGYFVIAISKAEELERILHKLQQVPGVVSAQRTESR